ncbi:hypothetical protein QVD99_007196 [Batrachochytrium dendrobatidis]|nr:hypothetical protein QVD99_007196 [Batrachochytrium dendrobatidis]
MPPKKIKKNPKNAKSTKNGKESKRSKSSKRESSRGDLKTPCSKVETSSLLTLVMCESHKFAVQHYLTEYTKAKEKYRINRESFHKAEKENHIKTESLVNDVDNLDAKYKKMEDQQDEFRRGLNIDLDPVIIFQMDTIEKLKTVIDNVKKDIELTRLRIIELTDFQLQSTEEILNEEITAIKLQAQAATQQHNNEIQELYIRHESSIVNTAKRAERIINAVEGVASQHQLDRLPESVMAEERLNRRLKQHLVKTKQQQVQFSEMIKQLEEKNMALVQNITMVDWNFSGGSAQELVDRSIQDVMPATQLLLATESKTSVLKWHEQIEPITLPPIVHPYPNRYLESLDLKNLDKCIMDIINMEVQRNNLNSTGNMGVRGHAFALKNVSALDLGPTKFYQLPKCVTTNTQ